MRSKLQNRRRNKGLTPSYVKSTSKSRNRDHPSKTQDRDLKEHFTKEGIQVPVHVWNVLGLVNPQDTEGRRGRYCCTLTNVAKTQETSKDVGHALPVRVWTVHPLWRTGCSSTNWVDCNTSLSPQVKGHSPHFRHQSHCISGYKFWGSHYLLDIAATTQESSLIRIIVSL